MSKVLLHTDAIYEDSVTHDLYRRLLDGTYELVSIGSAALVISGTSGGSGAVTTLQQFAVAGGASQIGTAVANPSGRCVFQAVANAQAAAAFTATVSIYGSLDNVNFDLLGTIVLSGTGATAATDSFATDAPYSFVRADVANLTGTLATCNVYRGL